MGNDIKCRLWTYTGGFPKLEERFQDIILEGGILDWSGAEDLPKVASTYFELVSKIIAVDERCILRGRCIE